MKKLFLIASFICIFPLLAYTVFAQNTETLYVNGILTQTVSGGTATAVDTTVISDKQILYSDGGTIAGSDNLSMDGTNASTIEPTSALHLVNKSYVDKAVTGISFDFFLSDTASDVNPYLVMQPDETGEAESLTTSATLTTGADQQIFHFATSSTQPTFDTLGQGVYDGHFHFSKTGTKATTIHWTLSSLTESGIAGSETLILTSSSSGNLAISKADYDIHAVLGSDLTIDGTDRLVMKVFATVGSGGSDVVITSYMEGTTDSHLEVRTESSAFNDEFVNVTGDTMTGDLNIEANLSIGEGLTLDGLLRASDGKVLADTVKTISVSIPKPLNLDEADTLPIWTNETGLTYNITGLKATSDTDDVVFTLKYIADPTDFGTLVTIGEFHVNINGTSVFYRNYIESDLSSSVVVAGGKIVFDNDSADDPKYLDFVLTGNFTKP